MEGGYTLFRVTIILPGGVNRRDRRCYESKRGPWAGSRIILNKRPLYLSRQSAVEGADLEVYFAKRSPLIGLPRAEWVGSMPLLSSYSLPIDSRDDILHSEGEP